MRASPVQFVAVSAVILAGMLLVGGLRDQHPPQSDGAATATEVVSSVEDGTERLSAVAKKDGTRASPVEAILDNRDLDSRGVGLALIEAIPDMPTGGRLEAVEHALLLLDDEVYRPAFELLVAGDTPDGVRELIMDDLLGRSPFLHLPLLVHLASLEDHPFRDEARLRLVTAVGDDYGTNWSGWADAVTVLLEASPAGVQGAELLQ